MVQCSVRDVLFQPDYAGHDYEDGGQDAPLQVRNAVLRCHFDIKPISLPRQARDEHRESTQAMAFLLVRQRRVLWWDLCHPHLLRQPAV
jgi:hypothetical protein